MKRTLFRLQQSYLHPCRRALHQAQYCICFLYSLNEQCLIFQAEYFRMSAHKLQLHQHIFQEIPSLNHRDWLYRNQLFYVPNNQLIRYDNTLMDHITEYATIGRIELWESCCLNSRDGSEARRLVNEGCTVVVAKQRLQLIGCVIINRWNKRFVGDELCFLCVDQRYRYKSSPQQHSVTLSYLWRHVIAMSIEQLRPTFQLITSFCATSNPQAVSALCAWHLKPLLMDFIAPANIVSLSQNSTALCINSFDTEIKEWSLCLWRILQYQCLIHQSRIRLKHW